MSQRKPCALIIFAGLPGVGKTTLARELARQLGAAYVRIDTIEQAIIASGLTPDAGTAGYSAGYAIAADNLGLGLTVVVDSVNALAVTREAWVEVAKAKGVPWIEVEVICSDAAEHRRRVEARTADIPGQKVLSWQDVLDRKSEPWQREHIVIDTAKISVEQGIEEIMKRLPGIGGVARPGSRD